MKPARLLLAPLLFCLLAASVRAAEVAASPVLPNVPPGFTIELAAGPPLVERPISAAFDYDGRLYVTESSGSNDPVGKQLELRPHRVVRLEDSDGDGKFDRRTIFADGLMLPQGAMFHNGSLYVAAPPSIWKLTDTDDDGVADERVEWFEGKTLTGCANDLHGPYLGPDGWLYWTKGGFAEQTHVVRGREWKSRAAHIFRSRADGSGLEPVITGGMDNPVGVAFTPEGERILTATFLETNVRHDGIVHAVQGAVYGKEHGVLEGHARTGELMPALARMHAAAPCGIQRYDCDAFGPEFRDNFFVCQFNLRKISRHVLQPEGSSYASENSDFVFSDNVDFHPTDVVMDADGSLLVIDTGGWYKLCCPTSTLWKPDVLGGIYRVRREGASPPADPRGRQIAWPELNVSQLWAQLADVRPAVRTRALAEIVHRRDTHELKHFLTASGDCLTADRNLLPLSDARQPARDPTLPDEPAALLRAWALVRLDTAESRPCIRSLLHHPDQRVRHVALNAASLNRDEEALPQLLEILASDTAANRRTAAEALGRIGKPAAIEPLLAAAARADDRLLQHAVTYALIEIANAPATRAGLVSREPGTLCAALIALDQMPGGGIAAEQVIGLLSSPDERTRQTARWLVARHPEWGGELAAWFRGRFAVLASQPDLQASAGRKAAIELETMLLPFVKDESVQELLADVVLDSEAPIAARALAIRLMGRAKPRQFPARWRAALVRALAEPRLLEAAVAAARELPTRPAPDDVLNKALLKVADAAQADPEVRVAALAIVARSRPQLGEPQFELLLNALSEDSSIGLRSAAAEALSTARLNQPQLERLCAALASVGPLEINRLLGAFAASKDEQLGLALVQALRGSPAVSALRFGVLREAVKEYSPRVQQAVNDLELEVNVDAAAQRQRLEELLPHVAEGDVNRGHAVFYSSKAACSACHRLGHGGGTIGPDLTRIGDSRTVRDLLESILYPSLSFVRGYEPVLVTTTDGQVLNATVRDETAHEVVLATGPDQEMRLSRDEIEQIEPSNVSIMPAGLEQQLSQQELADLIAYLKSRTSPPPAK